MEPAIGKLLQHEVLGLDVAMDDPGRVRSIEAHGDLLHHVEGSLDRESPALGDPLLKRDPF
jgi:hypothetical protein